MLTEKTVAIFALYCIFLSILCLLSFLCLSLTLGWTWLCKTRSLRANWFCSLLQFASKLGRSVLWIWNMTSLLLCLNGGCYVTSAIRNQREYNKRKTNVERCLAFKSNQMCFDHNNVRLVWISHYIETINLLLTLCQRPVWLCGFDMRECKSNSLIQTISEIM